MAEEARKGGLERNSIFWTFATLKAAQSAEGETFTQSTQCCDLSGALSIRLNLHHGVVSKATFNGIGFSWMGARVDKDVLD